MFNSLTYIIPERESETVEFKSSFCNQAKHRNKLLTEAFYLTGDIEKYRTGYISLRNWLKDYPELQYNVKNFVDFFRIELVEPQVGVQVEVQVEETQEAVNQEDTESNVQVDVQVDVQVGVQVEKLLLCLNSGSFTTKEIQQNLSLKQRHGVFINYIQPALKLGLIEMTIPDKPNSRLQKYRLTDKGKEFKKKIHTL